MLQGVMVPYATVKHAIVQLLEALGPRVAFDSAIECRQTERWRLGALLVTRRARTLSEKHGVLAGTCCCPKRG